MSDDKLQPIVGDAVTWKDGDYDYRGRVVAVRLKPPPPHVAPAADYQTKILVLEHVAARRCHRRNWYKEGPREVNAGHVTVVTVRDAVPRRSTPE
ncbi:MAG: hypothetical protein QOG85_825 [Gaiellaceae bacterium]|jgi:hypothetical protein|nr:hypothetical protein [Gaiellaceae bacterium]